MKNLFIAFFLISTVTLIIYFFQSDQDAAAAHTMILGIVLISAYLMAVFLKSAKLPKLTGYMLLGIFLGPICLNLLNTETLKQLHFLENMALSFIALTAGGELKYERMKQYRRDVFYLMLFQILVVFAGTMLIIQMFFSFIPYLSNLGEGVVIGFSILFAGTAVSKSPATTIGIITETGAKGKTTDIVLSITVLKSIILILFFPVIIGISKIYLYSETQLDFDYIFNLLVHISHSVLWGGLIGFIIILYLKFVEVEKTVFLIITAVIISELGSNLDLDILLISIVAGIVVENFSKRGEALIKTIEKSSLPLYILFFTFAGASLHLETVLNALLLTTILVIGRIILIVLGNYIGAIFAGSDQLTKNWSWLGFVGQAGIAVGLSAIIERTIPGEIGIQFKSILLAGVVINELLGPVLFKVLLFKAREISRGPVVQKHRIFHPKR